MNEADLELSVRAGSDGAFVADLRFCAPDSAVDTEMATGIPLAIDLEQLRALTMDISAYSQALTQMTFSAAALREAWAEIRGHVHATGVPLRVRLRLDPSADVLHHIRWEVLQDAKSGLALSCSERTLFSRHLATADLTGVRILPHSALRALVVISNPHDLATYHLAPLDVSVEHERIRTSLGQMPARFLMTQTGAERVSLRAISATLREGYPFLYLVCHGTLVHNQPHLWLEQDDGTCDHVPAYALVQRIADLDQARRPLLIVLASCQSAGNEQDDAFLAALGPQLAQAGVAAVLGFQGNVPISSVERLMPRFFELLLREDGIVDRALALARAEYMDEIAWWRPVLFLRLRDGKLWFRSHEAHQLQIANTALPSLDVAAIQEHVQQALVSEEINRFRTIFHATRTQIERLSTYKEIHDTLQNLETPFLLLDRHRRRLVSDLNAWDDLTEPAIDLQAMLQRVLTLLRAPTLSDEATWSEQQLLTSIQDFEAAFVTLDSRRLDTGIARVRRILARETSRVDTHIVSCARELRLDMVADVLETLHARLASTGVHGSIVHHLANLSEDVAIIGQRLMTLVRAHHRWQAIDNEIRRVGEGVSTTTTELELLWPDLMMLLQPLAAESNEDWAAQLTRLIHEIGALLETGDFSRVRRPFGMLRRIASQQFFAIDDELLHTCANLRQIGESLDLLLRVIDHEHR